MTVSESVKEMWNEYFSSLGEDSPAAPRADGFGDNDKDLNELAELVNQGVKQATAGALWTYEKLGLPLPAVGDVWVVTDAEDNAVCVVKTVKVTIIPFNEITEANARREGEGDGSLAYWKKVHIEFFERDLGNLGLTFDEAMPVIFEEFEKVWPKSKTAPVTGTTQQISKSPKV